MYTTIMNSKISTKTKRKNTKFFGKQEKFIHKNTHAHTYTRLSMQTQAGSHAKYNKIQQNRAAKFI